MFQKYRKLIIALIIVFAIPVFILLCCDITIKEVDENAETETETVVETVDPLDASALVAFDTGKGLTIKMSSEMEEEKSGDYSVYYFAENLMVSVKKVTFEELIEEGTADEKTTIEEYIQMVENANENVSFTKDSYGNFSTTYSAADDKYEMIYYVTVRKGSDAFWLINFAGLEEEKDIRIPQFELWGSTIAVQ
ncbi:MAG: hypothetical protein II251_07285 [Lachnospiraceae bacterium]|nr:hypothetical protein [Lachnospiraceae bacterium]